jgi:hypothetical protein
MPLATPLFNHCYMHKGSFGDSGIDPVASSLMPSIEMTAPHRSKTASKRAGSSRSCRPCRKRQVSPRIAVAEKATAVTNQSALKWTGQLKR